MAKSQETFGKKEKEKKRKKQQQEKREKMEERKANAKKGKSLDEMMAYVDDENGARIATPPDPGRRKYSSWKIWKPVHRSMCLAKPLTP